MAKKQKHNFPSVLFAGINDSCILGSDYEAAAYDDSEDGVVAEYKLVAVRKLFPSAREFDREDIE